MDRKTERRLAKLDALEAGGVDNWEGYDFSLEEWHKDNARDELIDEFVDVIHECTINAHVEYPAGREAGHSISLPEDEIIRALSDFADRLKKLN